MIEVWSKPHPIANSALNVPVGVLARFTRVQFREWAADVRQCLGAAYIERNVPPHDGTDCAVARREIKRLVSCSSESVLVCDELTGKRNVLMPRPRAGTFLRDFFPHRCESADGNADGFSLADYLTRGELGPKFVDKMERLVWRDRMFQLAPSLAIGAPQAYSAMNGHSWLCIPREAGLAGPLAPFWCEAVDSISDEFLSVSEETLTNLVEAGDVDARAIRFGGALGQHGAETPDPIRRYVLRAYRNPNQRVFPALFSLLTSGLVNQGTNFPPAVSKFLIERYGRRGRGNVTVLDPSAGYGGRLLGALAAVHDRHLTYVAVDPNSKNWATSRSRYDEIAEFYSGAIHPNAPTTVHAFCSGSETVASHLAFRWYRNRVDLAITSPPYFCAEIYAHEPTQSAIKFPTYPEWRDGFLRPTLRMCAEYLRPGGYLIWNIADVLHRGKYIPLEQDSCRASLEYGLEHVETYKLLLATMTGSNKIKGGLPTTKNYVRVNGRYRKCEPIFVFRKPEL